MIVRIQTLTLLSALCVAGAVSSSEVEVDPPLPEPIEIGAAIGEAELAPRFTTPSLKSASSELQAGRAANALRYLPSVPDDVPTKWLKAMALKAAEQPGRARPLFQQIAQKGGPLADRALYMAALCAVDEGNARTAEKLLGQISLRYVDADQALLERARQTMKLRSPGRGTAARVEEILAPILEGKLRADVASAHLIAGDAQFAARSKDKARAHWRAAWVEHPNSPAAESARDRERQLGPGPAVSPLLLARRAEILLDAHRNREALDQLGRIPVPSLCAGGCPGDRSPAGFLTAALSALGAFPEQHQPTPDDVAKTPVEPADPLACRVKLDQGRAWRKERDHARARAALAPVVLRCAEPDVRARALYVLAQIETIAGKPTAGPLWEALARKYPRSSLADDAVYNQALAARRAGDAEKERALLKDLVEHFPQSDLLADALFRLFWSHWLDGKPREGMAFLDQLAADPDADGYEEERARYWRARTLLQPQSSDNDATRAAAREAARTDLAWLVEGRPLTYYGLLAAGRLGELDPDRSRAIERGQDRLLQTPPPRALKTGMLARDPHLLAAVELIRLGFRQEAAREVSAIDRSPARAAGDAGQEPLTLVAELFARAGDLRSAHAVVRTELRGLLRHPDTALALRAAALAYPLAFREQIARVAEGAAIPPDLLQALMREESALDPRALSPTGALGLTQLMPATARGVAKKLKIQGYQTAHLLEPETNIRIGGAYLGELYARFQHPALALASYNAGPGAVSGWLKVRGSLPLDAFVEEIPLDETRGYVKRCLRSFAAYQYLYSNGHMPVVGQTLAAR
ncbi:MAG TPA: lytic transglycosylase domain-containing protein [Myxococcales bacterium]|nr:lytic transglycosylase domain-containing protein [Myxococcales bacterium]